MFVCTTLVEATLTIATFDDPAKDSNTPLFTVEFFNRITGGWPDSKTGLDLDVIYTGNTFLDAFFTMTDLTGVAGTGISYLHGIGGGPTGGGIIKFFADNQSTATTPLIQIDFDSANLSPIGFGGVELFGNDVVISGSEIGGATLTDEAFAFSFANQVIWPEESFTATSAFTSSAVPEPATVTLLGLSSLSLILRRRR